MAAAQPKWPARSLSSLPLLAVLAMVVTLGLTPCAADPQARQCAGCFTVPVRSAAQLARRSSVVYGVRNSSGSLLLDAYAPLAFDSTQYAQQRWPLALVVHGGGCVAGSRSDDYAVALSQALAQRGYLAFSIDYRLKGTCLDGGSTMAADDVRAAVRFARAQADTWRIDPTRIALVGASAGAIAVLEAALIPGFGLDTALLSNATQIANLHLNYSHTVSAVISLSGAVVNASALPAAANVSRDNLPPLYLFHGTIDDIVPVGGSIFVQQRAAALGQPAVLRLAAAGHVPVSLLSSTYMQDMFWFLREHLRLSPGVLNTTSGNGSAADAVQCLLTLEMWAYECHGGDGTDTGVAEPLAGPSARKSLPSLTYKGTPRTYRYYIPQSYFNRSEPIPAVVALHAASSSGDAFLWSTNLLAEAEAQGFIVLVPEGVARSSNAEDGQVWNGGSCCSPASTDNVDDVAFIRAMLADVAARGVDMDGLRVGAMGQGNGGMLALRLGCQASDQISSVASNAAALGNVNSSSCAVKCNANDTSATCFNQQTCPLLGGQTLPQLYSCDWQGQSLRPAPTMMNFGMQDPVIPFTGGQSVSAFFVRPAYYYINGIADQVGASLTAFVGNATPAGYSQYTAMGADPADLSVCRSCDTCASNFTVCINTIAGHNWPQGQPETVACFTNQASAACNATSQLYGKTSSALDTTLLFSNFLLRSTVSDFTLQFLQALASTTTSPASSTGLTTTGGSGASTSTVNPAAPVYLCAFPISGNCAFNSQGHCQQVLVDTCHSFTGMPPQYSLGTVYIQVRRSSQGTYSAGVYPNTDCTGQIVGNTVEVTGVTMGQCAKYSSPAFGNIVDFAIVAQCPICTPDASLTTAQPTTVVTTSTAAGTGPGTSSSSGKGRGLGLSHTAVIVIIAAAVACVVVISTSVVFIRRRQKRTGASYSNISSLSNPAFVDGDEDPEAFNAVYDDFVAPGQADYSDA